MADVEPGAASGLPSSLRSKTLGELLIFQGSTAAAGEEVWVTDGTAAGTRLLRDVNPGPTGSGPDQLRRFGGFVYFAASDPVNGRELWRTDGTPGGTALVGNIAPGNADSFPSIIGEFNGELWLIAGDTNFNREFWKVNGGGAPSLAAETQVGPTSGSPSRAFVAGDYIFFSAIDAQGNEPWRTSGTTASTFRIGNINPAGNSNPGNESVFDGVVFFVAIDNMGSATWRTTGNGTSVQKLDSAFTTNGAVSRNNGRFLLTGTSAGTGGELLVTDGIANATLLKDIFPGPTSSLAFMPNDDDPLGLFTADDGTTGREIWRTDATPGGTVNVMNLNPSGNGASGAIERMPDGAYLFSGNNGSTGMELFATDGTAAGTRLVADLEPGPGASSPAFAFRDPGPIQYFSATANGLGRELYVVGLPELSGGSGDAGGSPLGNPKALTVPVTASSPFATDLGTASIEGADAKSFKVDPGSCGAGAKLEARTSCDLAVTFTPREKGASSATLRMTHSDAANPLLVPLAGTATKDKQKPKLKAKGKLKNGVIKIKAGCDEICTITASAKGLGKAKAKKVEPGKKAKLKLPKKGRFGGRTAKVKLKAVDLSGNKSGKQLKLK